MAFADREAMFGYLAERSRSRPLVLVLDEFPYLASSAPALPSIAQLVWDHRLESTQLKLILSGSHITAMRALTGPDQPLFGRRTGQVAVGPFSYRDAGRFVPEYSARDRMVLYAVFGVLPGHLALADPSATLAENVSRQVLDPLSRLYEEGAHVFDAFLPDAGVHYSVVEAIAGGEHRWRKISNRIGKRDAALKRPIDWLQEMDVVARVAPVTAYPNPGPKSVRYRPTDPYLVFWHRFVADNRARGIATLSGPDELWSTMVEPRLDEHMGRCSRMPAASSLRGCRTRGSLFARCSWAAGGPPIRGRRWTWWRSRATATSWSASAGGGA